MRISLVSIFKPVALGLAVTAIIGFGQSVARADEVTLAGSTTGTVNGIPQLTFVGNSFSGTTAFNVGALSDENRLGTFTLATSSMALINGDFELNITFTQPAGITGGQNVTYTATIAGSVSPNVNSGGVNITFDQPATGTLFTFSNGTTSGMFTLTIADVFVQSGQSSNLTAGITGSQSSIPEPTSMLLLGTGLAGVAAVARRKLKARNQK